RPEERASDRDRRRRRAGAGGDSREAQGITARELREGAEVLGERPGAGRGTAREVWKSSFSEGKTRDRDDRLLYQSDVSRAGRALDARGGRSTVPDEDPRLREARAQVAGVPCDQPDGEGPGDRGSRRRRHGGAGDLRVSRGRVPGGGARARS